jgi:hypothetical protein
LKFIHKEFGGKDPKFVIVLYEENLLMYCMKIFSKIGEYNYRRVNDYVPISPKDNKFLKPGGLSFIKCFDIRYIKIRDILPQFDSLFKGDISNQTRNEILKVVKSLPDMTKDTREKIILSLESVNNENDKLR